MNNRDIIVIGASAGGFDVIRELVCALPADLPVSVFIVWHMAPTVRGILPQELRKCSKLAVAHAVNGEPIKQGRVYVAPPDHHLVLEKGFLRLTKGPKENRFRPAVDPLFRSAAIAYGPRVIGIVLSGALDDGSSGLWTIKEYGGTAIAQDPVEAEVASMPENAIRHVAVDHILPVSAMAERLMHLCCAPLTGDAYV